MNTVTSLFGQPYSMLELIAAVTGIAGVIFTVRRNILCFPAGIVNVLLYLYIFLLPDIRLYADALLQLAFCCLLIYGWIHWKKEGGGEPIRPGKMSTKEWIPFLALTLTGAIMLGIVLECWTSASLPWLDATLTAFSLGAQWMIARMKRENWWIWICVNTLYIPLYIYKALPVTALLYAVYLLLAVNGLRQWKLLSIQSGD
jgi:nicotinamide mononucleotide transporter